jgi:FkbM family methyltransferase
VRSDDSLLSRSKTLIIVSTIFNECIPPVITKLYNRIVRYRTKKPMRITPFNYLPSDIDVKWIMDIGANEGYLAKSALLSFKNAKIICFEPVTTTFNKLKNNLSPFGERVILKRMAVSDYTGESEINITTSDLANSLLPQSKYYEHYNPSIKSVVKEKITVVKLDDLIPDLPTDHFDVVKIDVEGLELKVLEGGKKFFNECVDVVMVEISFQRQYGWEHPTYLQIFNFLDSLDYRLINIYDVYNTTFDNGNILEDMMVTQIDCIFRKKAFCPDKSEGKNL